MPDKSQSLSVRDLNRALLARQMLLHRVKVPAFEAIEKLIGMQAQLPNSPYVGLWSRLDDFRHAELTQLYEERRVVRLAMMRSTIHLVTDDDCLALRPLLQPAVERSFNPGFWRHLASIERGELEAEGRRLVNAQPATFSELGRRLQARWPDHEADVMARAIRTRVPLVQVPPRGMWAKSSPAAHTTAEQWLGKSLSTETTTTQLMRRYLAAFGPASVMDAQAWSGLTRLRELFESMRPSLAVFRDDENRELFDLHDAPRPGGDVQAPVRFLPEFDNVLLAHRDRSRIISERYRSRVYPANGMIQPTVLVDGFVEGKWKVVSDGKKATLHVDAFRRFSKTEKQNVREEGSALLGFIAENAKARDIRISGP